MKRKFVLRAGAVLLAACFEMVGMGADTQVIALAAEIQEAEEAAEASTDNTEFQSEGDLNAEVSLPQDSENQNASEKREDTEGNTEGNLSEDTADIPDTAGGQWISEGSDSMDTPVEEQAEIVFSNRSVSVPVSALLPIQEQKETALLKSYDDLYLLHMKSDSRMVCTLVFNQALKESDVELHYFDSEKNEIIDEEKIQDKIDIQEEGRILSVSLKENSDCILVISHAENYTELGYLAEFALPQETEPSEPDETITEPEGEKESESPSSSEKEEKTPESALKAVRLNLDQDLETIPAVFADCLNDLEPYSVTLTYMDGTEKQFDKEDERYILSVEYEDVRDTEKTVNRTYHITVEETATGKRYEDTQSIVLGKSSPSEIKPEEMTTLMLEGKKKWIVVQSTPDITGRYALNSNKLLKNIYYAADDGNVFCSEDVLNLQQGTTYQFLIILK